MKKTLKFYIALWSAKLSKIILRKMKRNATNYPGKLALKICPDFLARIEKPNTIIGVTGTNGKTTVSNMIEDILEQNGYDFAENRYGSNIATGIATTLISGSNLKGKPKKDMAVLEIDERSATKVFPYITPTYLICTNLFRDSLMRNAHTEFIAKILSENIPKDTKIITNADDLIASNIANENEKIYFSIDKLDTDTENSNNIVRDIIACPNCNEKLEYEYYRYHHIGKAHCPNCDFRNPEADYIVKKIDYNKKIITIQSKDNIIEDYEITNTNIINIYNMLAAITLLKQLGLPYEKIKDGIKSIKIVETRYSEEEFENHKIVTHLAKGMNPIACSRAFEYAKETDGNKIAIVIVDDLHEDANGSENIAWQYDTDYEFLNDDSIKQIIVAGPRYLDSIVRMKIAGIPEEKIVYSKNEIEATEKANLDNIDKIVILHDLYSIKETENIKNKIKEMIKENN